MFPHVVKGPMSTTSSLALPPPPLYMLAQASLFLDLDGTLIEIASRPQDVEVGDELISLLADLNGLLQRRLVVVSGRPAGELRALLRELPLAMAGSHGVELRFADGREVRPAAMEPPPGMMSRLRQLMVEHAGVLIERKPYGVAIHHRLAPDAAPACRALAERLAALVAKAFRLKALAFEIFIVTIEAVASPSVVSATAFIALLATLYRVEFE